MVIARAHPSPPTSTSVFSSSSPEPLPDADFPGVSSCAAPPGARAEWGSLPGSSTGMRWSTTFSGAGELGVKALALLDTANTTAYGTPRITTVSTAACTRPGILVTGHDLKDLADLLESRPRGLGWTPTPTARCCRRTPTPVLRSMITLSGIMVAPGPSSGRSPSGDLRRYPASYIAHRAVDPLQTLSFERQGY